MITKRPSKLAATNPKAAYRPAIEPQATSTKLDTRKAIPGPSQAPGAKPTPQQTKPPRSQTLTSSQAVNRMLQ
jgi:hypothetical protein